MHISGEVLGQIAVAVISTTGAIVSALIHRNVKKVYYAVNSRMTEMLELARKAAHAEGVKDAQAQEDRNNARPNVRPKKR